MKKMVDDPSFVECVVSKRAHNKKTKRRECTPGPWGRGRRNTIRCCGKFDNSISIKHEYKAILKKFKKIKSSEVENVLLNEDRFYAGKKRYHIYT